MWGKFRYLELEAPHRITLINFFSNTESETVLVVPFGADWPLEMWTEYRFEAAGIQTLLYLTSHPLNSSDVSNHLLFEHLGNMRLGFKGTFDD